MGLRSNSIKLGVRQKMSKKIKGKTCCTCKCTCQKEESKTYDEWKALGRQVTIGEKSTGRNKDGKATFKRSQTSTTVYRRKPWDYMDFDNDDYDAMDLPF